MTTDRIFYKLLLRENGRLRSFNDERIVYYDENADTRDAYPLFIFSELNYVRHFASYDRYSKQTIWTVTCVNPRPLYYGKLPSESHEEFWRRVNDLQYLRSYTSPYIQSDDETRYCFDNELPRGTYVCDSLRLIERVF